MGFPGMERMKADAPVGGSWIKLIDDQPVRVAILGYVGTTTSKKYPDKTQYRFDAKDSEGAVKKLDCNFRLMKILQEMAEQVGGPFLATITQKKVIAEIEASDGTKSKKLVNEYTLTDVKDVSSENVPF